MGWDVEGLVRHLEYAFCTLKEHGHDVFLEIAQKDPVKAAKELPAYIERVLNMGNGFFKGTGAGGPHEFATGPLLDTVGLIYPCLDKDTRRIALKNCLGFLDEQNYFLSQRNVEMINEPWLVADIIANRWLYFCGYEEYSRKLKGMSSFDNFEQEFLQDGRFKIKSVFWLSFALARENAGVSGNVRYVFEERFPEFADRTKDAIATLVNYQALHADAKDSVPYDKTIDEKISHYYSAWGDDIRQKLKEEKWVLLPSTLRELDDMKKRPR